MSEKKPQEPLVITLPRMVRIDIPHVSMLLTKEQRDWLFRRCRESGTRIDEELARCVSMAFARYIETPPQG